jgi:hypothetical protein
MFWSLNIEVWDLPALLNRFVGICGIGRQFELDNNTVMTLHKLFNGEPISK